MNQPDERKQHDPQLRAAAETQLAKTGMAAMAETPARPVEDLLHDLQVHQIELDIQNEALRQANIALEDSRDRYVDLYEFAPVGYLTLTSDGMIAEINLTGTRLLGLERKNLLHRRFTSFVIPEDQDRWTRHYLSVKTDGGQGSAELALQRGDGTVFHVQLDCIRCEASTPGMRQEIGAGNAPIRVVLSDITARKQAEEALLEAGALQSAIFNNAHFSSIATDAKGIIQIFNVGAERMLGYLAADVMNKITPADISDPQEVIARATALSVELGTPIRPDFEALVFKASRGIEDIYELTYIRKDGSRFPAVVSVTDLRDTQDAIIGYLLIGTDNTARKQVEAERVLLDQALQQKNAELESARSAAEKANLAKSEFLSSMSHELRTPLHAILGFAQLMESGSPPPTISQKGKIDQIVKAGWYLLELINEILDLVLIESGKLSLALEPISLAEVMHDCQAMIEPQAQTRGIPMTFPQFEIPYFVQADRIRVKQILINLLSNAIKYNKVGGTVVVHCVASTPGRIRICVKDTGEGLTPEKLAQLFQPFNRLGQEANVEEGTGIGLVVTKRLVELMGGVIGVESTVGVGSVFWIELNLTAEPQPVAGAAEPRAVDQAQVQADAQLRTLLYVEDNPANLMLIKTLIERRPDIRLLSAVDGISGVEMARASLPDLILMDINLPGISGMQALRILRADAATAHIPLIALSANAMPHDIEKGLEAGFFRYLTKPIKLNQLMDALDVALKFAETAAQTTGDRTAKKEQE